MTVRERKFLRDLAQAIEDGKDDPNIEGYLKESAHELLEEGERDALVPLEERRDPTS